MAENSAKELGAYCKLITLCVCTFVCTCVCIYIKKVLHNLWAVTRIDTYLHNLTKRSKVSHPQLIIRHRLSSALHMLPSPSHIYFVARINWKSYCANADCLRSKVRGVHYTAGHGNKTICKPVRALIHDGV